MESATIQATSRTRRVAASLRPLGQTADQRVAVGDAELRCVPPGDKTPSTNSGVRGNRGHSQGCVFSLSLNGLLQTTDRRGLQIDSDVNTNGGERVIISVPVSVTPWWVRTRIYRRVHIDGFAGLHFHIHAASQDRAGPRSSMSRVHNTDGARRVLGLSGGHFLNDMILSALCCTPQTDI